MTLLKWMEAAENNKSSRVHWAKILGMSMNQYVAREHGRGREKEQIEIQIIQKCKDLGLDVTNLRDRIDIGVGARLGEMASEKTALKSGMREAMQYFGKIWQFQDGKQYIIVSPALQLKSGSKAKITIEIMEE